VLDGCWEIHDPTHLRYDTELGFTSDDSGFGPPVLTNGWIRTGATASVAPPAGMANCDAWTKAHDLGFGTNVLLTMNNSSTVTKVDPWHSEGKCDFPNRVWCVQD
jgi:hypothetical protein